MHVTIVSGIDPAVARAGGTRSYVLGLADRLRRRRIEVSLVARGTKSIPPDRRDYMSIPSRASSARFLLGLAAATPGLDIPRDSIIHVQRPDDLVPFAFAKRRNPKVCTLHGIPAVAVLRRRGPAYAAAYRALEQIGLRNAHRVIAVDAKTRSWFVGRYPWLAARARTVPVAIDTEQFRPMDREAARSRFGVTRQHVFLYAGRLAVEKRVEALISAVNDVRDAELLIAGDGPRGGALRALAGNGPVRFLGTVPHEAMPHLMNATDVLVLPSEFEGLPTAVLEALACGTPVVTTPVGALPEIVEPGKTGWLVAPDLSDLVRVLQEAVPAAQTLRTECVAAAQRFSWDVVLDRIVAIYREAEAAV